MAYAVIKTGGKQYPVEEGTTPLVEPLLYADGDKSVLGGDDLGKVKVEATIVGHERGPKLRVFKFKPKRGYKRRTGHRQELTRLQVTKINLGSRASSRAKKE